MGMFQKRRFNAVGLASPARARSEESFRNKGTRNIDDEPGTYSTVSPELGQGTSGNPGQAASMQVDASILGGGGSRILQPQK